LYYVGKRTEKNIKKAFYWYQKIATSDLKTKHEFKNEEISYKMKKLFEPVMRLQLN